MSHEDDADRPATFREVLASGEYRALYLATVLSWFGDYLARAAVTALVYNETKSVALSAATFAISYLPWLGFGPILAALAERLPYRRTMIAADLIRMVLIGLVAIPDLPVWAVITLLFATALCNPPFDAARSALTAKILDGDRYVAGLTLTTTSNQVAQVVGYLSGAGLSTVDPHGALLFNAVTFGISACLVGLRIHPRPPALAAADRTDLLRETAGGLGVVFGSPLLRSIAIIVFISAMFAVVPEGLAAAWAATEAHGSDMQGWIQGTIMVANPLGVVVGGLAVGRFVGPKRRQRLVPIFAVAVPATLVPAMLAPPVAGIAALAFCCGLASAGLVPSTNGIFVQALPNAFRARAFGVMKSGIAVLHGVAVFATGALADIFPLPTVVGLWGVFGVVMMAVAIMTWPNSQQIADEIERARALNSAGEKTERWRAPSPGAGGMRTAEPRNGYARDAYPGGAAGPTGTPVNPGAGPLADHDPRGSHDAWAGDRYPGEGPAPREQYRANGAAQPEQPVTSRRQPGRHRAASV